MTIGLIGYGRMGKIYHRILLELGHELAWIVDPAVSGPRIFDSLDQALRFSTVSGVIVASPVETHLEHVLRCISEGFHVLCEKPLAVTSDDCAVIYNSLRNSVVQVGFMRRHDYLYGNIYNHDWPQIQLFQASSWDKHRQGGFGGGLIPDLGIHDIHLALQIGGPVKNVRATGGEQSALVTMEFLFGGGLAVIDLGAGVYRTTTTVISSEGVVTVPSPPQHESFETRFYEAYKEQVKRFVHSAIVSIDNGSKEVRQAGEVAKIVEDAVKSFNQEQA